jgi:hypothetical protein
MIKFNSRSQNIIVFIIYIILLIIIPLIIRGIAENNKYLEQIDQAEINKQLLELDKIFGPKGE